VAHLRASALDVWDRGVNRLELWGSSGDPPDGADEAVGVDEALGEASAVLGRDLLAIAADPRLKAVEADISSQASSLPAVYDAPKVLQALCYVLCRAIEPVSVVETGVANGATSACLLAALDEIRGGRLHSIDWMPGGRRRRQPIGELVPDGLRKRWEIDRGPSRRLLPRLLRRIDPPALFVHDSDHTYRNMRRELEIVTQVLRNPGAILVDDIQANASFTSWIREAQPTYSARVLTEQPGHLVGLALLA
jgi:hypothetical protein